MKKQNDRNEKYENQGSQIEKGPKKTQNTGLKIAVAIMSLVVIGLSIGLVVVSMRKNNDTTLTQATFQRSYFDLVAQTSDLSVKMNKLDAASTAEQQEQLLYEIWKNADLAQITLTALSSKDTGVQSLIKFMNQMGDYSHYLAIELSGDKTLDEDQQKSMKEMSDILKDVNKSLSEVQFDIENGGLEVGDESVLSDTLSQLFEKFCDTGVDYPQLIYDGPFSDALADKETIGLTGENIDKVKGESIVKEFFEDEKIKEIKFDGEWNSDIDTLNYSVKVENDEEVHVQLAKKGGNLLLLNRNRQIKNPKLSTEQGIEKAEKFMSQRNFGELKSVWCSNISGIYYVNLAPIQNDIIIYPDIIKVKVASDDGAILGVDTKNYAYNHTDRDFVTPKLSVTDAKKLIKPSLNPNEGRLAVIPYQCSNEKLAYEFYCEGDEIYFIYIDVVTGKEINILYVIDSENGKLLM